MSLALRPSSTRNICWNHRLEPDCASDDYFHDSAIYLTPGLRSLPEAIDLAVNFAAILGAKPHFLDPAEHDSLTALTEGIPQVLSIAAYSAAMNHGAWADAQRLTNPPFNVLTRYLLTHHPDALRDEWLANRDGLGRAIDQLIDQLRELRGALADHDEDGIEAFLIAASDEYQLLDQPAAQRRLGRAAQHKSRHRKHDRGQFVRRRDHAAAVWQQRQQPLSESFVLNFANRLTTWRKSVRVVPREVHGKMQEILQIGRGDKKGASHHESCTEHIDSIAGPNSADAEFGGGICAG